MPQVANPHKRFQFSIFIFGMNPFLAQKVTLPDVEIDKIEHGEGNYKVKTAGMISYSELRVEKISSASLSDLLIWGWIKSIQNEFLGGGVIPEVYKKAIQVQKLANDGVTPIGMWNYFGAWPSKINGVELDRLSSDNTIESVEFTVDKSNFI